MQAPGSGDPLRLLPPDAMVLDSGVNRAELPCTLKPMNPALGFDLRFHAGYEVSVPIRELLPSNDVLTVIFRVTGQSAPNAPVHLLQKWRVPPRDENAEGSGHLTGSFVLGVGEYQIDWLMRNRAESYCSGSWRVSATLRGKDRQIPLRIAPGAVQPSQSDLFGEEEPVARDLAHPLAVLVLLHLAPAEEGAASMHPGETLVLVSILRNIARDPRIGSISISAFNVEQAKVLYRQENDSRVDFPALKQAVQQLQPHAISIDRLRAKDDESSFLAGLVSSETARRRPDALIFIGPKLLPYASAAGKSLKALNEPACPVFYLNYDTAWGTNLWRDMIGSVVKQWRGIEYTITKPGDLFFAWEQMMSRISDGKVAAAASPHTAGMK